MTVCVGKFVENRASKYQVPTRRTELCVRPDFEAAPVVRYGDTPLGGKTDATTCAAEGRGFNPLQMQVCSVHICLRYV